MNNILKHYRLIIIGSGPAGCTAAIYAARANLSPLVITGNAVGGQLVEASIVDNWPGDVSSSSGAVVMERMLNHVKQFNIEMSYEKIEKVNLLKRPFELYSSTIQYTCDALIIATGASPRLLGLQSEVKYAGKGVSLCATCDGFFYRGKNVAVIGGGNSALTEALYLSNIVKKVTIIHRGNNFRGDKIIVDNVNSKVNNGNIEVRFNEVVEDILGDGNKVTEIKVKNVNDQQVNKFDIDGVFIAIGHEPNSKVFADQLEMINGFIKIRSGNNGNATATNIRGVFASGDVTDRIYKQSIIASGSGCMAALDARNYLSEENLM